jgi:hypothetical protein
MRIPWWPLTLLIVRCTLGVHADTTPPYLGSLDVIQGSNSVEVEELQEIAPGFYLASVDPDQGSPGGGDKITIEGNGFREGDRVFFGEVPSPDVRYHDPTRLVALTPAHDLGLADVTVRHDDGEEQAAERAFLYARPVMLADLDPDWGPVAGGAAVTITFQGADRRARVLAGDRLVTGRWGTDGRFSGVLPPLRAGENDLLVLTPGAAYAFPGVLRGVPEMIVTRAEPLVVPAGSGGRVELVGQGFEPGTQVRLAGELAAEVLVANDGTRLSLPVPPGAPGWLDLEVLAPHAAVSVDAALLRVAEGAAPELLGVRPDLGEPAGGEELSLALSGVDAAGVSAVRVCGRLAAVSLAEGPGLTVLSPIGQEGPCAVEVDLDGSTLVLQGGFTYRARRPSVTSMVPDAGPAGGGSEVVLRGVFPYGLRGVRFCGLPAPLVAPLPPDAFLVHTPAAAPGPCAVSLDVDGTWYDVEPDFTFRAGRTEVLAVVPGSTSQAGGGRLRVLGTDLPGDAEVSLGLEPAEVLSRSAGTCLVRAPRADGPRPVDVHVAGGGGQWSLWRGVRYIDPARSQDGTWGGPIRDVVNVTVRNSANRHRVEGALISLRRPDGTFALARTDDRGQAVIDEDRLRGRVDLTASRAQHSAFTLVGFDATNVVLSILGPVPPASGTGIPTGEPAFKPAQIQGQVFGLDKFAPPPIAPCGPPEHQGGTCTPCASEGDCRQPLRCEPNGQFGRACLPECAAEGECPAGFDCIPSGDGTSLCHPVRGEVRTYCFPSRSGGLPSPYDLDEKFLVLPDGTFYLGEVRLGELAVVCLHGYLPADPAGEFVPTLMGAARHLFTVSDTLLDGVRVEMSIPLVDSPPFEVTGYLDRPGAFSAFAFQATLDLGADGVFTMPGAADFVDDTRLVFHSLPRAMAGDIYDARLHFILHADSGDFSYAPYAEAYHFGLAAFQEDRFFTFPQGTPYEHPLSLSLDFTDLARTAAGEVLATTRDGRVLRFAGGTWYGLPVVAPHALLGLASRDGLTVAVGEQGGLAVSRDGVWEAPTALGERDLRAAWIAPGGEVVLVGDRRIWEGPLGALREAKPPDRLSGVAGDEAGVLWAVGDAGAVYRRQQGAWQRLEPFTGMDLRAVAVSPDGAEVYLGGKGGVLARLDPVTLQASAIPGLAGRDVGSLALDGPVLWVGVRGGLYRVEGGSVAFTDLDDSFNTTGVLLEAGLPSLAVGAVALELGPIFPPDRFLSPERRGTWSGRVLHWFLPPPDLAASYNEVNLYDYFGMPVWSVLAGASVSSVALPPLDAWGEYDPLARPALRLQFDHMLAGGFTIDDFGLYDTGMSSWVAGLFDYFELLRSY